MKRHRTNQDKERRLLLLAEMMRNVRIIRQRELEQRETERSGR